MRMNRDTLYASVAILVAQRGTCNRARAGAVLVKDQRIIAIGYNGAPSGMPHCLDVGCEMKDGGCIRTVHAEANLIAFAAKEGISTNNCTVYITFEPCLTCAKLMINAGIRRVVILGKQGAYPRSADGVALLVKANVSMTYMDVGPLEIKYDYPGPRQSAVEDVNAVH